MKKILTYISVGAFAAMSAVSCDLDLTPKGSITYTEGQQIITSSSDLEGFEANILACFRSLEYGEFDVTPDVMVDYFNAASDFGNNYGGVHRTDDSYTASDYYIEDNWMYPYTYIKNFNIFLEGSTDVSEDLKEATDIVRGEAFLARAFAYLHLARHYGKAYDSATASTDLCVPLVTEYNQNERPARATVEEVYTQIKADLDSAAVLLASVPGEVRAQYPTIDAVNAMKARWYLDTGDYANAASTAMSLINSGTYALSRTDTQMENEWLYDSGTEPIMQFYASTSEGRGSHSPYTGFTLVGGTMYYQPYFIPTKALVEAYDESDLRFTWWFDGGVTDTRRGNSVSGGLASYHNSTVYNEDQIQYYVFIKYYGNPNLQTSSTNVAYNAIKPFLISEMYLIAAEAYLGAGDTSSATTVLTDLQSARGASTTGATETTVRNEWFRETVGEGLRFSCLKRWGIGFDERTAQDGAYSAYVVNEGAYYDQRSIEAGSYLFQWPIPTYELQTNLNLVQNEGYGSAE